MLPHGQKEAVQDSWLQKEYARNDVDNDPFLTHTLQIARPQTSPHEPVQSVAEAVPKETDVNVDPFMTHQPGQPPLGSLLPRQLIDPGDPFMNHRPPQDPFSTQRIPQGKVKVAGRTTPLDTLMAFLGAGDSERSPQVLRTLSALPWFAFVWTLMLWLVMRHYYYTVCVTLNIVLALGSLGCIGAGMRGRIGRQGAPLLPVGILCGSALLLGTGIGLGSWEYLFRPYWWYQTGRHVEGTSADTPAGARADAAVVGFWDEAAGHTVEGTAVDYERSAGYKAAGSMYCVAPILSPTAVFNELARVNYWAIGIDCCEPHGSFICDDSRNHLGRYGVVMLDNGFPCPGCNTDLFKAAIHKAESAHGMVSTTNPLFVRWVVEPTSIRWSLAWRCMLCFVVSCFLASWFFTGFAWVLWYKGVGKDGANQWLELQQFVVRGIRKRLPLKMPPPTPVPGAGMPWGNMQPGVFNPGMMQANPSNNVGMMPGMMPQFQQGGGGMNPQMQAHRIPNIGALNVS